jgi:GNAT superfamily N-acetyltransferase
MYDPTLWLLARDGVVPVGVLTASAAGDRGWVDYLAVSASHRGRGMGAALLRRSFAMFADRDIRRVLVSVMHFREGRQLERWFLPSDLAAWDAMLGGPA